MSTHKPNAVALLGGTFDPIHNGHILTAQQTAKWLGINQVQLIPAHIPPHKEATHASAQQRAEMVNLVCNDNPTFALDTRELKRHSASFTVETLQELVAENPNTVFFFIMGMDSILSFSQWHQWQKILTLCHIVVNVRPGYHHNFSNSLLSPKLESESSLDPLLIPYIIHHRAELYQHPFGKIIFHDCTPYNISSTDLREQIRSEQPYQKHLPVQVYQYIKTQNLYR
jgi:nicotinate-nucleotide adenylyltransferase